MGLPWRVLIACSAAEGRQRLADVLSAWKLDVVFAASVQEARKVLREQDIAQVFCEETLSDGDFQDVLEAMGTSRPKKYLVALLRNEQRCVEAMQHGAFDVVPVHYRPSDIRWLIFRAIRHAEDTRRFKERVAA